MNSSEANAPRGAYPGRSYHVKSRTFHQASKPPPTVDASKASSSEHNREMVRARGKAEADSQNSRILNS